MAQYLGRYLYPELSKRHYDFFAEMVKPSNEFVIEINSTQDTAESQYLSIPDYKKHISWSYAKD